MPVAFGTAALAPVLRMFAGPAPGTWFADKTGDRKSAFFRIPFIGKTHLRSSVWDSSLGGKSKAPSVPAAPPETPPAMPVIGEPRKALLPCAPSKTLCIPCSIRKKRHGGSRSRSPARRPRRLQSILQTPSLLRGTPARRARLRRLFGTGLLCRNLLGGTRLLDCRLPA